MNKIIVFSLIILFVIIIVSLVIYIIKTKKQLNLNKKFSKYTIK